MFSNFKNILFHNKENSIGSYFFIPITRVKPKKYIQGCNTRYMNLKREKLAKYHYFSLMVDLFPIEFEVMFQFLVLFLF